MPSQQRQVRSGSADGAASAAAAAGAPLLERLLSFAGISREPLLPPVLPVRTHRPKTGCSPGSGGRRQHRQASDGGRVGRAAAAAAIVLALACSAAGALAGTYFISILYEPPSAVAAAAAEAAAAVSKAWVDGQTGAAAASDPLQPPDPIVQHLGELVHWKYTAVVMSYGGRRATLPMVLRKLGSCPSVSEVLLVWNGGGDPPSLPSISSQAPVRIRAESQNDLSNRLRPDAGIRTEAVLLADDDELLRCADVERAFARWQTDQQALVGFFPRLTSPGPPPQYLGEKAVFRTGRYNVMLTAAEFVSLDLLRLYWSKQYAEGRAVVSQHTNCEDILLNFVAAAAIRELPTAGAAAAAGEDPPSRWPPYVLWVQPSRRLDISLLSGVGLSRGRAAHEVTRSKCVARFSALYGDLLEQEESIHYDAAMRRPLCWLPLFGCVYL